MTTPHVVFHCAGMGNWPEVIRELMLALRESGLANALASIGDVVRITHVGDVHSREWTLAEAARQDVPAICVRSDPNIMHYETFAMLEIERLAKEERTDRPVLYLHSKGVSDPHNVSKILWRRAMTHYVVNKWRENLHHIRDGGDYDAAGFNWWNHGERHFSGTYWIARADWIRRLPDFVGFHHAHNLVRYSCELWIGALANPHCRAYTLGTMDAVTWDGRFDFAPHQPPLPNLTEQITWVTAATPSYLGDLTRLQSSFGLLGPGHQLIAMILPDSGTWRHSTKLEILRQVLPSVRTSHVFWIDSDCEFLTALRPRDFLDPARPLAAVRHFAFDSPRDVIPECHHARLPAECGQIYWQACLWGGGVGAVAELLDRTHWIVDEPRGYDEHALNIEWCRSPHLVHTLPCRYAAPTDFAPMPQYRERYAERAAGEARVSHVNREIRR